MKQLKGLTSPRGSSKSVILIITTLWLLAVPTLHARTLEANTAAAVMDTGGELDTYQELNDYLEIIPPSSPPSNAPLPQPLVSSPSSMAASPSPPPLPAPAASPPPAAPSSSPLMTPTPAPAASLSATPPPQASPPIFHPPPLPAVDTLPSPPPLVYNDYGLLDYETYRDPSSGVDETPLEYTDEIFTSPPPPRPPVDEFEETLSPPPAVPPPAPQSPPPFSQGSGKGRTKLKFTAYIPKFTVDTFSAGPQELFLLAIKTAAVAAGAEYPPNLAIKVDERDSSTRRRRLLSFSSAGVNVHITADFVNGDAPAAAALANSLQSEPQTIFPVTLFGPVTVPTIEMKKVLGAGARAGIAVGIVAGIAGVTAGLTAAVIIKRRRRIRQEALEAIQRDLARASQCAWWGSQRDMADSPHLHHIASTYSDGSDEGSTLRELYAVKQAIAGHPVPSRYSGGTSSPRLSDAITLFDNPLADLQEGDDGKDVAAGTAGGAVGRGSPAPAVLAGWFSEARIKFAQKRKMQEEK